MHSILKRAVALAAASAAVVIAAPVAPANAHGETAQESFLRMGTVAFINTEFSVGDGVEADLKVGDKFTIKGIGKILDVWPQQLGEPEMGFIGLVAPGPVVLTKTRLVNGRVTPHAFEVEKGGVYTYELGVVARRPGRWHVHPIFGVQHAGSLIGPGLYLNISGDLANFENNVTLANGDVINLEDYGKTQLYWWNIVWFVLGMIWLLYWIVPKPTVTRLPVNLQIPLNTDGEVYGLITKQDHRVSDAIMAVTLVLTVVGMVWQGQVYPEKIPQQVLRYKPPAAEVANFATAQGLDADFNTDSSTLSFPVNITNTGDTPISVKAFTATSYTWSPDSEDHPLTVEGDTTIAPGATGTATLVMKDDVWTDEKLMPVGESRLQVTGVVILENEAGEESYVTAQGFVISSSIAS